MPSLRSHPAVVIATLVVVVAVGWWLVAPQAVGGPMAYLVVRGSSMAPTFAPGDLVVVRHDPPYRPGDVVAYRTPDGASDDTGDAGGSGEGSRPVIVHRVVDLDGDRLVLRGDANEAADAIRPAPEDVLGRQVAVVPGVGTALGALRSPIIGLAVVALGLAGWAAVTGPGRRRRRHDAPPPRTDEPSGAERSAAGGSPPDVGSDPLRSLVVRRFGPPWLWGVLALMVGVAAVGVVRTPVAVEAGESVPWTVRTSFGWDQPPTGDPVATEVYGEDGLRTGDTVFLSATPVLPLRLVTTLSLPAAPPPADAASDEVPLAAGGTGATVDASLNVEATLVSDAGWRRPVATPAPVSLEAGSAEVDLAVDLPAAWATAVAAGSAAGRLGEVRLEVVATTSSGDGAIVAAAVQPFLLDAVAAEPLPPEALEGSVGSATGTSAAAPDPRELPGVVSGGDTAAAAVTGSSGVPSGSVALEGSVTSSRVVAGSITVGPVRVSRPAASVVVAGAAVVVLVGALASVLATSRARRQGEASLLATRHRWSLVPLRSAPAAMAGDPVDVASFDALRRVAGTVNQPIGVATAGGTATFWVTDGARTWRYRPASD